MKLLSRELADTLNELGVKIESEFIWYKDTSTARMDRPSGYMTLMRKPPKLSKVDVWFQAPSADELMDAMPDYVELVKRNEEGSLYWAGMDKCFFAPEIKTAMPNYHWETADTAADALGKLAIWLVENGYLKTEDK